MKKIFTILLLISMILSMSVMTYADPELDYEKLGTSTINVVNKNEISKIIESVLNEYDVSELDIAVTYCYTATGEAFSKNASQWYDGCGLCVIPGMMELVNCEDNDLVAKIDSSIGINTAMEASLANSRNRYGLLVIDALFDSWKDFRTSELELVNKESIELPNSYYYDASYSVSLINEYMFDIYNSSEHYSKILDYMKQAQPGEYLKAGEKAGQYTIAQKGGVDENRAAVTGIVYTENPIIISILTRNVGSYNASRMFGSLADRLIEYTENTADKAYREITASEPVVQETVIETEVIEEFDTTVEPQIAAEQEPESLVPVNTANIETESVVDDGVGDIIEEKAETDTSEEVVNLNDNQDVLTASDNMNRENENSQLENNVSQPEVTEEMTQEMLEEELQRKAEAEEARRLEAEAIDVAGVNKTLDDYTAIVFCVAVIVLFIIFIIVKLVKMIRG